MSLKSNLFAAVNYIKIWLLRSNYKISFDKINLLYIPLHVSCGYIYFLSICVCRVFQRLQKYLAGLHQDHKYYLSKWRPYHFNIWLIISESNVSKIILFLWLISFNAPSNQQMTVAALDQQVSTMWTLHRRGSQARPASENTLESSS